MNQAQHDWENFKAGFTKLGEAASQAAEGFRQFAVAIKSTPYARTVKVNASPGQLARWERKRIMADRNWNRNAFKASRSKHRRKALKWGRVHDRMQSFVIGW